MMTPEDDLFIRAFYAKLEPNPDTPIEPDSPLYVPLYERPGTHDPIEFIRSGIELGGAQSVHFFSGCIGSGKTTELYRLRRRLTEGAYTVFFAGADKYLNLIDPITASDLIIAVAGALSDACETKIAYNSAHENYWTRFLNFLKRTDATLTDFSFGGVAGVKAEVKLAFRYNETFRQRIQRHLATQIAELKKEADQFIAETLERLREEGGGANGVVFLFDGLEKISGIETNRAAVMGSVETVFAQGKDFLAFPDLHIVYTVPPYLRYRAPGLLRVHSLPCAKLWEPNTATRHRAASGWQALREVIERRVGMENMERFFGKPGKTGQYSLADRFIEYSGGHLRDLLYLLRAVIILARTAKTLPITREMVDESINLIRRDFPLAEDDAVWLCKITETRESKLPNDSVETVNRFATFLDRHLVLLFANGREWYDVHPLIYDEVVRLAKRANVAAGTAPDKSA